LKDRENQLATDLQAANIEINRLRSLLKRPTSQQADVHKRLNSTETTLADGVDEGSTV
jgi:hypothetical protein